MARIQWEEPSVEYRVRPVPKRAEAFSSLSAMIPDACEARSIYVIPAVDDETVAAFSDMRGVAKGDTTTEVMLYDPEERYLNRDERTAYLEGCRTQLAANGIRLISRRLPEAEARKEDNNVG